MRPGIANQAETRMAQQGLVRSLTVAASSGGRFLTGAVRIVGANPARSVTD